MNAGHCIPVICFVYNKILICFHIAFVLFVLLVFDNSGLFCDFLLNDLTYPFHDRYCSLFLKISVKLSFSVSLSLKSHLLYSRFYFIFLLTVGYVMNVAFVSIVSVNHIYYFYYIYHSHLVYFYCFFRCKITIVSFLDFLCVFTVEI